MEKERNSNFELLRIIAMLMIVAYHIWCHSIKMQLIVDNTYFIQPIIYKRLFIFGIISPFGQVANSLFLLISGYFMCEKDSINITKISRKLLSQLLYATIVLVLASTVVYKIYRSAYISLLDINFFNTSSWFIGYYFIVILCAYLFLNKNLNRLDKKEYLTFLVILFTASQLSFSLGVINNVSDGFNRVLIGLFLYSLGGYIKKYNPFSNVKIGILILLIIFINIFILLSTYNHISSNIEYYYQNVNNGIFNQSIINFEDYYMVPILLSICVFEIFKRIKIRKNKVINFIGSSTLMIYLLHDNEFVYSIWNSTNWLQLINSSLFAFLYKYLVYTLGVFEIGLLIYIIYSFIEKRIVNYLKRTM